MKSVVVRTNVHTNVLLEGAGITGDFVLLWCVRVCARVCMCAGVYEYAYMWKGMWNPDVSLKYHSSGAVLLVSLRQISHWDPRLTPFVYAVWPVNPRGFFHLCLPSTGIASMHRHVCPLTWVLRIEFSSSFL